MSRSRVTDELLEKMQAESKLRHAEKRPRITNSQFKFPPPIEVISPPPKPKKQKKKKAPVVKIEKPPVPKPERKVNFEQLRKFLSS